jgi:hypothetical protein
LILQFRHRLLKGILSGYQVSLDAQHPVSFQEFTQSQKLPIEWVAQVSKPRDPGNQK